MLKYFTKFLLLYKSFKKHCQIISRNYKFIRSRKLQLFISFLQKNPSIDINVEDEYLRQYPLKVAVQLQKEVSILSQFQQRTELCPISKPHCRDVPVKPHPLPNVSQGLGQMYQRNTLDGVTGNWYPLVKLYPVTLIPEHLKTIAPGRLCFCSS